MSRIDKILMTVIGCIKTQLDEWNHKVGKYEKKRILHISFLNGLHFFRRMYGRQKSF
jgi:hypothetical protein